MQLTHTISVIEAIWLLGCLPGLLFTTRIAHRAAVDLALLRTRRINSIREYAAITSLILFTFLALTQFCYVLIGVMAMTYPSPPHGVSPVSYGIAGVFLTLSFMSSSTAYLVDKRRRSLIEKIREIEDMGGKVG